jgi:hypothetical protein
MAHRADIFVSGVLPLLPRPLPEATQGPTCRPVFLTARLAVPFDFSSYCQTGRAASALADAEPDSAAATLRQRNGKQLAASVILGFSRHMSGAIRSGSKLSACPTRQAEKRPGAVFLLELGKGGNPPLHPPCRFLRHAETVPVSVPFGLHAAFAPSSSYEVCR